MHQLLRARLQAGRAGGRQLKVELVPDAAAALAVAALRAPGTRRPGDVEVDPAAGALTAPPAVFRALVAGGEPAPHPLLAAAAATIRAPDGRISIEAADGPVVEAWAGARVAALTVVAGDGRVRLVPLPAGALEPAVAVLAHVDDDAPAPPGPPIAMGAGALAALLAGDPAAAATPALTGARDHRRVTVEGADIAVELLRADDGPRRIVASGAGVELQPAAASELRAAIAALLAPAQRS